MASFTYHDDDDQMTPPIKRCDHPGCEEEGLYPAPKSRANLREHHHFCLDHVREYNKRWNYFSGYNEEQIYEQILNDTRWDRPTWPSSIPLKMEQRLHDFVRKFTADGATGHTNGANGKNSHTAITKEAQALETLGLPPQSDQKSIKTRYRELVKKYHPDTNPNNPKAVERFKIVSEAYMILRSQWHVKGS